MADHIDYKTWFERMGRVNPKVENIPTDGSSSIHSTMFWENLYQAFKARYEAEKK